MPTATISIYLKNDEMKEYLNNRVKIHEEVREFVKRSIGVDEDGSDN